MRSRPTILASLTLTVVLAACSSSSPGWTPLPSGAEPPAACARPNADGVIEISADDLKFSVPCMVARADEAFVIRLTNNEGVVHNVAIYADRSKGTTHMNGDTITGPDTSIDYEIDALPAGDYYFDCIVHPADMNGALYVR
jgi:plastocyanin